MAYLVNLLFLFIVSSPQQTAFEIYGEQYGVDPTILEGICRYESDNGRVLRYKNKNGSWDVGYCMNHRGKSDKPPDIPSKRASIREAAKELAYWKRQHRKFCANYKRTKRCGSHKWGKWRGVRRCWRNHAWFGHYNWGFQVTNNHYDRKVQCFIDNGFKKCEEKKWRKIRF